MTQYVTFRRPDRRYLTSRARRIAGEGLQKGLEHVLNVSQQQVPLDEDTLQRSGRVVRDGLNGYIVYDTVYAKRQHEEMTWKHLPGRKAKYLEDPMNSERDVVLRFMAVGLRRWLRG